MISIPCDVEVTGTEKTDAPHTAHGPIIWLSSKSLTVKRLGISTIAVVPVKLPFVPSRYIVPVQGNDGV